MLGGFLAQRRFETWLLGGFALAALLMAAVGLYGILQYSMATRTREIGLRLAIGAQPGDIFRMLVGEGLRLSGMGLALGLAGALAAGPMASRLLFGVTPLDPWTFTGVVLLMTAVALLACLLPARRAMRIEPTSALREG
jgi:ABC-type antimicrobial peptide transport system permease subunit